MSLTIIAATNYSETARNAVIYAAGLAKSTNSKLLLFNAFGLSIHSSNSLISADEMQIQLDKAVLKLKNLGKEIADLFKIEVETFCSFSFIEEELSILIENTDADLVVMGMAERTFEQELLGNTTTAVIKNIDIPVLAVPRKARFNKISRILYACDTLSFSATKRFNWIANLMGDFGFEIEFFSVDESVLELKKRSMQPKSNETEFEDVKYIYKTVKSNDVINEIEKEIKHYNADILVMVPKKYGFWDSLVHKSKTRIMAAGIDIPMLSFPHQ